MTNAKTFRLFISSTFSDFKVERQVLHEKVFPNIDKYCTEKGYQFQPVDLRWGVSNEAQLDQKTLELCLNEVRACKHYPHPNFLIMLGERYGWVALPYKIEAKEFEALFSHVQTHRPEQLTYLEHWYKKDSNCMPASYVLRERRDERGNASLPTLFQKDFATQNDPQHEYNIHWAEDEGVLRELLQEAANAHFTDKQDKEYRKYFLSATEAEVEEGIFKYSDSLTSTQEKLAKEQGNLPDLDTQYVYGWIRNISDIDTLDRSTAPASFYSDSNKELKKASQRFRERLTTILDEHGNVKESEVALSDDPDRPIIDRTYLDTFETYILDKLKAAVDRQVEETQEISTLGQERSEQLRFKSLKSETFFGREDELKSIQEYIESSSSQPFIVHGVSGIGKSSFIAKAIDQTDKAFYRFIGATASSSNIRTLLELLINDLADKDVVALPKTFEEDSNSFNQQIKELLSSIERPTVIILDALDQLQHKDYLQWLPLELPKGCKIVLSMLDQEGYDHYFKLLASKIGPDNRLPIEPLDEGYARETLRDLLEREHRSLTGEQFDYVMEQYNQSGGSPLYLKIAFEEAKSWQSSDLDEELRISVHEIVKEFIDNLVERYHHDRGIVHKVLGLIAASRDGLSEREILDILSRNEAILNSLEKFHKLTLTIDGKETRRFPISIWVRLHEQLKPFLNERLVDGQNLLNFFHRQISEAVHDYCYENNALKLHAELADYFLTLQNEEKRWDERYSYPHMLEELPYQLFHAKESTKLKELLFDLEFTGSIYDHNKQEGFREIMEVSTELEGITDVEIYNLESFYRENEHIVVNVDETMFKQHQVLFQLAYEMGMDAGLRESAERLLKNDRVDWLWLQKKSIVKVENRGLNFYYKEDITASTAIDEENTLCLLATGKFIVINQEGKVVEMFLHTLPQRFITNHESNKIEYLDDGRVLIYFYENIDLGADISSTTRNVLHFDLKSGSIIPFEEDEAVLCDYDVLHLKETFVTCSGSELRSWSVDGKSVSQITLEYGEILPYDSSKSRETPLHTSSDKMDLLDEIDAIFTKGAGSLGSIVSIQPLNENEFCSIGLGLQSNEGSEQVVSVTLTYLDWNLTQTHSSSLNVAFHKPVDLIKTAYSNLISQKAVKDNGDNDPKLWDYVKWITSMNVVRTDRVNEDNKVFILSNKNILFVTSHDLVLLDENGHELGRGSGQAEVHQTIVTEDDEILLLTGRYKNAIERWSATTKLRRKSVQYNKKPIEKLYRLNDEFLLCRSKEKGFLYLYDYKASRFYSGLVLEQKSIVDVIINAKDISIITADGLYSFRIEKVLENRKKIFEIGLINRYLETVRIGNVHQVVKAMNRRGANGSINHSKNLMIWYVLMGIPLLGFVTSVFELIYLLLKDVVSIVSKKSIFRTLYHQLVFSKKHLLFSDQKVLALAAAGQDSITYVIKQDGADSIVIREAELTDLVADIEPCDVLPSVNIGVSMYLYNLYNYRITGLKENMLKIVYLDELNKMKDQVYLLQQGNSNITFEQVCLENGEVQ